MDIVEPGGSSKSIAISARDRLSEFWRARVSPTAVQAFREKDDLTSSISRLFDHGQGPADVLFHLPACDEHLPHPNLQGQLSI
jgi:hypothetical protein